MSLKALFSQDEWISENGISVNSDGSTNNHTDYYVYCRDFWVKSLVFQFWFYIIWGLLVSSMMYYLTYFSLQGAFLSNGMTIDFLNAGVIAFYVNIFSHHVMCILE